MGMEISGKLYKKFDAKQITERFTKRELVVEIEDGRYPQLIMFQLTGKRIDILDDFQEGDAVNVEFSLRGREWTSPQGDIKYFNSLEVWSLQKAGGRRDDRDDDDPPLPDEPPPGAMDADDVPF